MGVYALCAAAAVAGLALWDRGQVVAQGAVLVWGAGLTLLVYGLIRDLYLVIRGHEEDDLPKVRLAMMCFESTTGFAGVALGLALHFLGWTPVVTLPAGAVVLGMAAVVAGGHATRDWVLVLVVVPNHRNLIPTWKPARMDAAAAAALAESAGNTSGRSEV